MRKLVESLVSSAEGLVASEKTRHAEAAADHSARVEDLAAMSADVAQMRADTNAAVAATEAARVEQAAADAAARADFEAARLADAAADHSARVEDIAVISADVVQMNLDTDAEIAEFAASRTESADLLNMALRTINDIRNGVVAAPPAKKARAPRKAAAVIEWGPDHRPTRDDIFAFIADHPDGVSLVEMEAHFNTARIVLQRPVKEMYEVDHQVTRDEDSGKYFAV